MAETFQAVLLLLALMVGGAFIGFNLVHTVLGFDLGLGFNQIGSFQAGFWIIIARLVGIALIGICGYVIFNIITK